MTKFKAKDGHEVDSDLELRVDNALNMADLTHRVQPSIPGCNFKADFLVGDVFVEVWGIKGDPKYEERKQKKLSFYTARGFAKRLVGGRS